MTFAKQGPGKADDDARPGNGFVDVFAPNGDLLRRLVSRGKLDSPWAVTLAPPTFGAFGGDILVGNFGNGRIDAYDPTSGEFQGELSTAAAARSLSTGSGDCASPQRRRVQARTRCSSPPVSMTKPTGCSERSSRTDSR